MCGEEVEEEVVVVVVRTMLDHVRFGRGTGAGATVPSAGLTSENPLRLLPAEAGSRRPQRRTQPTPMLGKRWRGTAHLSPSS